MPQAKSKITTAASQRSKNSLMAVSMRKALESRMSQMDPDAAADPDAPWAKPGGGGGVGSTSAKLASFKWVPLPDRLCGTTVGTAAPNLVGGLHAVSPYENRAHLCAAESWVAKR